MRYEIHVLPERLVRYRVLDHGLQASGDRLETRLRSCLELQELFARYLALGSLAELWSVFPRLQVPHGAADEDLPFVLAGHALRIQRRACQEFGIRTLFRLMAEPSTAARLKERFGFDPMRLMDLSGACDVYDRVNALRAEAALQELQERLAVK